MATLNKIQLIGHLGKDPEARYSEGGTAVAKVSLAVSRPYPAQDETDWFNVVALGKKAEFLNEYGRKGRRVYVEGVMQNNRYTTESGETRDWWEVKVADIQFLDRDTD